MTHPVKSRKHDVSIITISKNDLDGFQRTLDSVRSQKFNNFEVIAVVHSSSESTLEFARALVLEDTRIILVVDTDEGIYQAMNIGIKNSIGKYLIFMNSGDKFESPDSLDVLFQKIEKESAALVIGDFRVANQRKNAKNLIEGQVTAESFAFNRNWGCHQAMLFRNLKDQNFELEYSLASDFDFVLRYFELGKVFRISACVAEISPGGLADSNLTRVYLEKYRIRSKRLKGLKYRLMNILWTCLAIVKWYAKKLR